MLAAAEELRFEYAAKLRDEIRDLRHEYDLAGRHGFRAKQMTNRTPQFERDLENTEAGLALDLGPESDVILIAFGGLLGRLGAVPLFEFFNVVSTFGVKKAFVRDLNQCWYHRGVVGVGADIPAVAEPPCERHLRKRRNPLGARRELGRRLRRAALWPAAGRR